MAISPTEHLWVRRIDGKGPATRIDVFGPTGTYIGTLPRAMPFPNSFMPNGDIVALRSSAWGTPEIVVYRLTQ